MPSKHPFISIDTRYVYIYHTYMKLPNRLTSFHWDKGNQDKNWHKHHITNQEAEEVFLNKPLIISPDPTHSTQKEQRFHALGRTKNNRQLFISYTLRNNHIRIISARLQSRKERGIYAKEKS